MKIYFSPEYSGVVYIKPEDGKNVMMDTIVVNTIGLVNMLELRFGIHYEKESEHERLAKYYAAMCKYMEANPGNILEKSFKVSGLATAQAVMRWRDELRMVYWHFKGEEISKRLAAIIGIEEYFKQDSGVDLAERLHNVIDKVMYQKPDCKDIEIIVPCSIRYMETIVGDLIAMLEYECGAKYTIKYTVENGNDNLSKVRDSFDYDRKDKIKLNIDDDSLLIYKFPDERAANEYLSFMDMEDVDVWINADNKQMDNWLKLMGHSRTGSVMNDCTPQLTQLFVMGIGLFGNPMNVNTLIEWLNMPIHPMGSSFRRRLADTIVGEGGYRNDACKKVIEDYINGVFVFLDEEQKNLPEDEQQKIRMADMMKRKGLVKIFLPEMEYQPAECNGVPTEKLKTFTEKLGGWAKQHAHLLVQEEEKALWAEQLMAVATMCDAFGMLVETVKDNTIDFKTIDSWVSIIYGKDSYTNAIPERFCRTVVNSPAKIISFPEKTVWMGVEGESRHSVDCDFLYPTEREALKDEQSVQFMGDYEVNKYHELMEMTPLMKTKRQLIMVVCERRGGEKTQKHPFIVRLEELTENIEEIIRYPKIDERYMEEVDMVESGGVAQEIEFEHSELLKWPDHMSPTSIGTLAEYPFDYMMERLLHIEADAKAQMQDVKTTMGNVAHAVIAALFAPRDGQRVASPKEIEERIKAEYDNTFVRIVEAKGAILLLRENKLKQKLLNEQLKSCLDVLVDIMKDNRLKVTGCERYVEDMMGLGLPKKVMMNGETAERDVLGYIDMSLEDENGRPIVFDFKWTSSKSYYPTLLENNRSVQLEMYRRMLSKETKDQVERVAYFLMPEARLYSREDFTGRNCVKIDSENYDNIVLQLKNSVIFRKKQIDGGKIETNGNFDELEYVKNTESEGLYPLIKDEGQGIKADNIFSNYSLFNA